MNMSLSTRSIEVRDKPVIHVVAAAIVQNDRVLLAKRPLHVHQGGKWEFPGGKVESDESAEEALIRELEEELGIRPTRFRPLIKTRYQYPEKRVLLDVWLVEEFEGDPYGREEQLVAWVLLDTLDQYELPPANYPVLSALRLPEYCAITPVDMMLDSELFFQVRESVARHPLVLLRAPLLARKDYAELAEKFAHITSGARTELLLTSNAESVYALDAAGLHYSTRRLMAATKRPIGNDKYFSAACHSAQEIKQAKKLEADFIFLSPVRNTSSHPQASPLGWSEFAFLCGQFDRPVYALGGVSMEDLPLAWQHGAQGVAGISHFWKMK